MLLDRQGAGERPQGGWAESPGARLTRQDGHRDRQTIAQSDCRQVSTAHSGLAGSGRPAGRSGGSRLVDCLCRTECNSTANRENKGHRFFLCLSVPTSLRPNPFLLAKPWTYVVAGSNTSETSSILAGMLDAHAPPPTPLAHSLRYP